MKKSVLLFLLIGCSVTLPLLGQSDPGIQTTGAGTMVGKSPNKGVGFHGTAPTAQRAGSAQAVVGSQTGYVRVADLKPVFFTGNNGAGNITVTGLATGDTIKRVVNLTDSADATTDFDTTGTNLIHQTSATNYSAKKFIGFVVSANSTTDIAALKTLVNELRAALVAKGLIKGAP